MLIKFIFLFASVQISVSLKDYMTVTVGESGHDLWCLESVNMDFKLLHDIKVTGYQYDVTYD